MYRRAGIGALVPCTISAGEGRAGTPGSLRPSPADGPDGINNRGGYRFHCWGVCGEGGGGDGCDRKSVTMFAVAVGPLAAVVAVPVVAAVAALAAVAAVAVAAGAAVRAIAAVQASMVGVETSL